MLVALCLFGGASGALHAQDARDGRCGAGQDLVVQALETAGPQATADNFQDALQLLKRAAALCPQLGDAWYYRSLIEQRLGHAPLARFAAEQAQLAHSEAQAQSAQPFTLSTPAGPTHRGVPGTVAPSAPGAPPAQTPGPLGQKWALVIGIGRFADRAIPQLNYTATDAQSFAAVLMDPAVGRFPKSNVTVLLDADATTRRIKEELNRIARAAQPNDMVVIYLATHGSPRDFDSVGALNYLVTYDTEIKSADTPDQDALYATAYPMVDLSNTVATRMHALRTLVVLDTCYSGGSIKHGGARMMGTGLANASPSAAALQRMSAGSGRIVLAAARDDQESLESPDLRHGYFTYFLMKQLRDTHGLTPVSQVYASVSQQVATRVAQDTRTEGGFQQNPVMDRSADDADFALGLATGSTSAFLRAEPNPFLLANK
jgi:uncharacterized caspase-like protein